MGQQPIYTALVTKRVPAQIPLQLFLLQLLKVAGIQRKIIRMILKVFCNVCLMSLVLWENLQKQHSYSHFQNLDGVGAGVPNFIKF